MFRLARCWTSKGPEIRLGKIEGGKTVLKDGDPFTLTTEQIVGDNTRASVSFQDLTKDVKEGDRILIDDGLIELQVQKVSDKEIRASCSTAAPSPTTRASTCRTSSCRCRT